LQTGKEAAAQIGALLLTASLSTAVNAVKGNNILDESSGLR
jgi:hypothetical protein